jgi:hypothetical protein
MTGDVLDIVLANVAYAVFGIGLAALVGVFDRRRTTYADALIGVPLGIAGVMLVAGNAAVLGFAVTPTVIALLAVAAATSGGWQLYRRRSPFDLTETGWSWFERLAGAGSAIAIAWVLIAAARAMAVKPVAEWDGWVLWATKARVLYEHPSDGAAILQPGFYGAPSYPVGMPALEATTMRAVGHFDSALVDLQLLALAAAAIVGIWVLLRRYAHPAVIGLALLTPLASSQLTSQLTTNYADVPLAFLTAVGVVAGGVWLTAGAEGRTWMLVCFSVFLGAAAWTKNEGLLFAIAAVVALVATSFVARRNVRQALGAAAGFVVLAAPWWVYASANNLETRDYNLTDLLDFGLLRDRADRVWPAAHELLQQMTVADAWGASFAIIVLSVAAALLTRRRVAGIYAAVWLVLAFGGLVATYWISNHRLDNNLENSSWRTIVTLLVTGLCLTPLLLEGAVTYIRDAIASLSPLQLSKRRGQRPRRVAS